MSNVITEMSHDLLTTMTAIDQTDNFTDHLLITIIKPNTEKIPDQNKETTIEQ